MKPLGFLLALFVSFAAHAASRPNIELAAELSGRMVRIVAAQANDVPVNWRRFLRSAPTR